MSNTLGVHWIATTHGSWLHGDVRGSWKDGRLIGPDPFREEAIRKRMESDAVVLSQTEVICVASVVGQTVVEQGHRAYAATFQSTHLHVVFGTLNEDAKTIIARLKKRTADLVLKVRRNRGDARKHLWTRGQFPVFIFSESHLHNAVEYVRRHNMRGGGEAEPYDWVSPL